MYAVEFETLVEGNTIRIPEEYREFEFHNVKIILMMNDRSVSPKERIPGTARGKIYVSDDFEQPFEN